MKTGRQTPRFFVESANDVIARFTNVKRAIRPERNSKRPADTGIAGGTAVTRVISLAVAGNRDNFTSDGKRLIDENQQTSLKQAK